MQAEVEPQGKGEKVIYLTFDDGPSSITYKVLDILKENNVKATFFLIGNQIKGYENIVNRINEEEYGIGLHTYTHNFKAIYASKKSFIKEMLDTRDEINKYYKKQGYEFKVIKEDTPEHYFPYKKATFFNFFL